MKILSFARCLKCFADGKRDFIVLEDVSPKGYVTINRDDALNLELTVFILESFAKFHALSIAYKEHDPKEFEKIAECVKVRKTFNNHCIILLFKMWNFRKHIFTKDIENGIQK